MAAWPFGHLGRRLTADERYQRDLLPDGIDLIEYDEPDVRKTQRTFTFTSFTSPDQPATPSVEVDLRMPSYEPEAVARIAREVRRRIRRWREGRA